MRILFQRHTYHPRLSILISFLLLYLADIFRYISCFHKPRISVFSLLSSKSSGTVEGDLPANLKRKVDAKRPPLGHVVPKATKNSSKKGGMYTELVKIKSFSNVNSFRLVFKISIYIAISFSYTTPNRIAKPKIAPTR